jgi:hypothetical protein
MLQYNIHERPLVFESTLLYHANTPHLSGTRYSIVLYNKDMRWACDKEPTAKRTQPLSADTDIHYLDTSNMDMDTVENARSALLNALQHTTFQNDRCTNGNTHSKYPDTEFSKFLSFGNTLCRKSRSHQASHGITNRQGVNPNNAKHPVLFEALCGYLNTLQPNLFGVDESVFQYTSLIVTKNALCRFHLDNTNYGNACILALGDYTGGGDLRIDVDRSNDELLLQA